MWSGPDQPTPNPATERRLRPRTQAERAFAAILARVLAQPRRPHATALDQTARRIEFGLETLRGCEH